MGGFQKNNYLWGMWTFVDIFFFFFFWGGGGGHRKTGLCLGVISMHFRVFS